MLNVVFFVAVTHQVPKAAAQSVPEARALTQKQEWRQGEAGPQAASIPKGKVRNHHLQAHSEEEVHSTSREQLPWIALIFYIQYQVLQMEKACQKR